MKYNLIKDLESTLSFKEQEYGPYEIMIDNVIKQWGDIISDLIRTDISKEQFILCMMSLKLNRIINDYRHKDSIVDLCGYAAILYDLIEKNDKDFYNEQ